MEPKCSIRDYSLDELEGLLSELKQPRFRARQLYEWLYVNKVTCFDDMTNLPKHLRDELSANTPFSTLTMAERRVSDDGTRKYLFRLYDEELVETVAIPSTTDNRLTVCFSTQVGCAMECAFCATGREGFKRNLTSGEIIEQVLLAENDCGMRVSNLVGMGQGEPFLNYENTLKALRILNDPSGMAIGSRHITVSTCGICEGVERFSAEPEQFVLAVSLHSARQYTRNLIMPRVANQPLDQLKQALQHYEKLKGRRVSLEYLLLDGVNDQPEDLEALLSFCSELFCHINFLPMNAVAGSSFQPSPQHVVKRWISCCAEHGIETTLRTSRGSDIDGACGQLKGALAKQRTAL